MSTILEVNDEVDAATRLEEDIAKSSGHPTSRGHKWIMLGMELHRAERLLNDGQLLEALGLLQATLPALKEHTADHRFYCDGMDALVDVFLQLNRDREALETAADVFAFATAKYGPENRKTLKTKKVYATTCVKLGRLDESKTIFEEVLATETRIFGCDHPSTQVTRQGMQIFVGFAQASTSG